MGNQSYCDQCDEVLNSEDELKKHKLTQHMINNSSQTEVTVLVERTRPSSDSDAPTFNEQTIQSVDKSTKP